MREEKKHAFNTIAEDIKAGNIGNLVLLYGTEQYLVGWARDRLIERYTQVATRAMDLVVFESGSFDHRNSDDLGRFREACETVPMMSERKVVVIEDCKAVKSKDAGAFADYLGVLPEFCLLILTAAEKDDRSKIGGDIVTSKGSVYDSARQAGGLYEFTALSERDLTKFINKRLNAAGKNIEPRAMNTLLQMSGYFNNDIDYALFNLNSDIEKIAALAEGDLIKEQDVVRGLSDNLEYNTFKMLDSISKNNKETAFKLMHDMMLAGANENRLLATISGQLELMLMVKELTEKGYSQAEIKKELGVHEYRIKKAAGFAQGYSQDELRRVLKTAYDTDDRIKSGLLDGPFALEMLIASI